MKLSLQSLRRELRKYVDDSIARLFSFTLVGNTSALGDADEVLTTDQPPAGEKDPLQKPTRRIEPWGVRGRPVAKKVRSLSLRLGSSNILTIGYSSDGGYGPTDLAPGETALFSEEVEKGVHLTSDGDTKIASKDTKLVTLNGDDYSLPTWDAYATDSNNFLDTVSAIVIPPTPTAAQVATAVNAIIAAAATWQALFAGALDYKSSKVKNG